MAMERSDFLMDEKGMSRFSFYTYFSVVLEWNCWCSLTLFWATVMFFSIYYWKESFLRSRS
jgi:hypothetical protein